MAAPKGNQFWLLVSSFGPKPKFTPETLWKASIEYFAWNKQNPLIEYKPIVVKGNLILSETPKLRAMTVSALCLFLDVSMQCWNEYTHREGFGDVTAKIVEIIRNQKFEGAAADLFNANIIARDLGLADRSEYSGRDGGNIKVEDVTDDDARLRALSLLFAKIKEKKKK